STRAHAGLGLGLALVKHLVELHGGSVVAHSAGRGQGSTFVVKLPVTIARLPAPQSHPTASSMDALPEGARLDDLRVLVVEDDSDALELAAAMLKGAGASVRTCLSATEALEVLHQLWLHVLVSDSEMPCYDGYTLIKEVCILDLDRGVQSPAV